MARTSWFDEVEGRCRDYLKLGANWDSYGARPIDPGAIELGLTILEACCLETTPEPRTYPLQSGGVGFEWEIVPYWLNLDIGTDFIEMAGGDDSKNIDWEQSWKGVVPNLEIIKLQIAEIDQWQPKPVSSN